MKSVIQKVSEMFIQEAQASPRMLEDLASMEKYMAESYDGRTFVELLQNADDVNASAVKVFSAGDTLIVANSGRPFNENDIMSICRSGSSDKKRGTFIGYRGVGFKSTTTISSEIVIYSSGAYFTFSKKKCAHILNKDEDKVPTIRIPFLLEERELSQDIVSAVENAECDGFTTFFIFLKADIRKLLSELEGFCSGWLLFLKNITKVEIDLSEIKATCRMIRKTINKNDTVIKIVGTKEQWYITSDGRVSIAFKYDDEYGIIQCNNSEANFHCFLPTLDKSGYLFKANADFSTDPSRKHLISDSLTKKALEDIERLYVSFINRISLENDNMLLSAISLIVSPCSLNELAAELEKGIMQRLRTSEWVLTNTGLLYSPENVEVFPNWLTEEEQNLLSIYSDDICKVMPKKEWLDRIENIEKLLYKLGSKEISSNVFLYLLTQENIVTKLNAPIIGKLFVYGCRRYWPNRNDLANVFVPLENGTYKKLSEVTGGTILSSEFTALLMAISEKEKEMLVNNFDVFKALFEKTTNPIKQTRSLRESIKPQNNTTNSISKWKTPVQNCISVEALNGWSAKDVSKKNTEYSVQSTNSKGDIRYLIVKKVDILGDSFKLSEHEYSALQRLGANIEIFVQSTGSSEVEYSYIKKPLNEIKLSKMVKEWEWRCEDYEVKKDGGEGHDNKEVVDDKLLKLVSIEYFNRHQVSLLNKIVQGYNKIEQGEASLIEQINSIVDFYTGSPLLFITDECVSMLPDKESAIKKMLNK